MCDTEAGKKGLFRRLAEFALDYDVKQAVESQVTVNVQYPEFAEGAYNLGILYYSQGKVDAAIDAYEHAIKLDPSYAKAHKNLGEIYVIQDRYDLAWQHARAAEQSGNTKLVEMLSRYGITQRPASKKS